MILKFYLESEEIMLFFPGYHLLAILSIDISQTIPLMHNRCTLGYESCEIFRNRVSVFFRCGDFLHVLQKLN